MSDTVLTAIIGGTAGLLTGILGTFFAPWVSWGIEKKKIQLMKKKKRIDGWIELLQNYSTVGFLQHTQVKFLRPYLNPSTVELINKKIGSLDHGEDDIEIKNAIAKDIHNLEIKWKLI